MAKILIILAIGYILFTTYLWFLAKGVGYFEAERIRDRMFLKFSIIAWPLAAVFLILLAIPNIFKKWKNSNTRK
jgi:hypothetical protein